MHNNFVQRCLVNKRTSWVETRNRFVPILLIVVVQDLQGKVV